MDKEKIEEIKNFLYQLRNGYFCPKDCFNCYESIGGLKFDCDNIAKNLYEQGYRKINDNEVVISNEEYKALTSQRYMFKDGKIELIPSAVEIRKETAEKILSDIKFLIEERNGADIEDLSVDGTILEEVLEELAKEFGVEIKE